MELLCVRPAINLQYRKNRKPKATNSQGEGVEGENRITEVEKREKREDQQTMHVNTI